MLADRLLHIRNCSGFRLADCGRRILLRGRGALCKTDHPRPVENNSQENNRDDDAAGNAPGPENGSCYDVSSLFRTPFSLSCVVADACSKVRCNLFTPDRQACQEKNGKTGWVICETLRNRLLRLQLGAMCVVGKFWDFPLARRGAGGLFCLSAFAFCGPFVCVFLVAGGVGFCVDVVCEEVA
jgi:hypothetical protein